MAKQDVVMPQMGESITTGTITKWHKKEGDSIEIDEILLEISTDKVESEIPSPIEGKVVKLLFEEGETIDVGVAIAYIDDDMDASVEEEKDSKPDEEKKPEKKPEKKTEKKPEKNPEKKQADRFYTPLVRKLAKENDVDLSELKELEGSGAGGRVNRSDFEAYLEDSRKY